MTNIDQYNYSVLLSWSLAESGQGGPHQSGQSDRSGRDGQAARADVSSPQQCGKSGQSQAEAGHCPH